VAVGNSVEEGRTTGVLVGSDVSIGSGLEVDITVGVASGGTVSVAKDIDFVGVAVNGFGGVWEGVLGR